MKKGLWKFRDTLKNACIVLSEFKRNTNMTRSRIPIKTNKKKTKQAQKWD